MIVNKRLMIIVVVVLVVGIVIGRGCANRSVTHAGHEQPGTGEAAVKFWTCSMHPQIQQPGPGQCPHCGMDLIPVSDDTGAEELGIRELKLSANAEALADVEVARVERRFVTNPIRMVGKVEFDETRLAYITARVPGRLDRLYVDYTGVEVKEGDHMVYLYSPELLSAQEELIQAVEAVKNLENSESSLIQDRAESTVEASREKLRLWGLNETQISEIEQRKQPDEHVTIYSPISGVVIHKNSLEGEYVKTGSRIYTLADLSRVWVKLDAYESDLAWLHYGQEVEFSTEAYPGNIFRGKIAFIDPILNPKTRTVKVRVNVENPDGRLKPDMFVRAVVKSRVARGGNVFAPELAGKWISPMHPEIVKDEPGPCDICGMALVRAESLGYVLGQDEEAPLVIPATAPLITGKRAVVYVRDPERKGIYAGREIVLGPRAGNHYLVKEGLREGELVVYQGSFKIDSAIQIMAKPSMMNPKGGGPSSGHQHGGHGTPTPAGSSKEPQHEGHEHEEPTTPATYQAPADFKVQLADVYDAYLLVGNALAANEPQQVKASAESVTTSLDKVDMALLKGEAHMAWMSQMRRLREAAKTLSSDDIETVRKSFSDLSEALASAVKAFGLGDEQKLYILKCPMALDGRGAMWLQDSAQTHNPYFSGGMLRCGGVIEEIPGE